MILPQIAAHLPNLLADASSVINQSAGAACGSSCNTGLSLPKVFSSLTGALIFLIGAISVVMIIIGGLRYVLSNGDPKSAEGAKNTILYAVIGVIVAIASYAIVKFVTGAIK